MVECKYLEWVDSTAWHGDVFDHPSYKSVCQLYKQDIHSHYTCIKCSYYTPDYERLSDYELRNEFRMIKEILESDDRMQPMSAYTVAKLTNQRNCLQSEAHKRCLNL